MESLSSLWALLVGKQVFAGLAGTHNDAQRVAKFRAERALNCGRKRLSLDEPSGQRAFCWPSWPEIL